VSEVFQISQLSLVISGLATGISLLLGLPVGTLLALSRFPGRPFLLSLVNTGMGLPPVVVGLAVAISLWRSGPLGDLQLIYTPTAIVIAQVIIALPVVTGLTTAALQALDPRLRLQLYGLGASRMQMIFSLWREARLPLLAAMMAGFGSVISEVGASMMVGGNIPGETRTIAIAIYDRVQAFDNRSAGTMSAILLLISMAAIASWQRTSPVKVCQFRCGSFIGVGRPEEWSSTLASYSAVVGPSEKTPSTWPATGPGSGSPTATGPLL